MEKSLGMDELKFGKKVDNVESEQSQEVSSFATASGSSLWL